MKFLVDNLDASWVAIGIIFGIPLLCVMAVVVYGMFSKRVAEEYDKQVDEDGEHKYPECELCHQRHNGATVKGKRMWK